MGALWPLGSRITLELAPSIVTRIGALGDGGFVYRYADVLGGCLRQLVHPAAVRIIRVGYPRVILRAVRSLITWHALFSLDVAPLIISRIVALQGGLLIVGESDVILSRWLVAQSVALYIVRIANPCVQRLAVFAWLTRHSLQSVLSIRSVPCNKDIFIGIFLPSEDIAVGLSAVLGLEQPPPGIVRDTPQWWIGGAVLHRALPRGVTHANNTQIRHEQSGVPSAHVDGADAVLSPELAPGVGCGVSALLLGQLIHRDTDILRVGIGHLIHIAAVLVVRIGYPCVVLCAVLAFLAGDTLQALVAFYLAPLVVGWGVALRCGQLVIRQADVFFSGRVIGDAITLVIVRISYPRVIGHAVISLVAGHALRALRATLSGFALRTSLSLCSLLALGTLLARVALVHLLQPVGIPLRRRGGCPVLIHAQPQTAVIREPVVVVRMVVLRRPRPAVVGRAYRRAVGLGL